MNGRTLKIAALCIAVSAVTFFVTNRLGGVQGQQSAQVQQMTPGTGFAAIPGMKGGQDVFGPYDPVQNWPRPLAESLPNHDAWTWSQATDVFAESPDRVYLLGGGELPNIKRPQAKRYPDVGPNVQFPVGGLPWRNANQEAPPGGGG